MDELDQQILKYLCEDARLSYRKIAEFTGKSTDTIINRYKAMEKKGIIRGNAITIDRGLLGFEGVALFHIVTGNYENLNTEDIISEISKMKNILLVSKTIGTYDIIVMAAVKGLVHFEELCVSIAILPGIKDINSCYWTGKKQVSAKHFLF